MITKVVCLTNTNQYESKIYFSQQLGKAMTRAGIEAHVIDIKRKWDKELLLQIKLFDPDFTCSFNSFFKTQLRACPWDLNQIPHLMMLLDPAFYSVQFTKSPYAFFSSVDQEDCNWFRSKGCPRIFHWPHAVERELLDEAAEEKIYDVVFLGTITDFEAIRVKWHQILPFEQSEILENAADLVLSDPTVSLMQGLVKAWEESGLDSREGDFHELFYFLDNYTRGKDRYELIRAIKDAPVHIFGEPSWLNPFEGVGAEAYFGQQKNVTIHPAVPFRKGLDIIKKSKICLNSMPFFKYGSHERILTGLAGRSLPITMENVYVNTNFEVGKDLLIYRPQKWADVNELVNYYLAHEEERLAIVNAGREKVRAGHTWDARVEQMQKDVPSILELITHRTS